MQSVAISLSATAMTLPELVEWMLTIWPNASETYLSNVVQRMARGKLLRSHRGYAPEDLMGREISGRTLGLIGLGHVGRRVAPLAAAFGMTVLATDPAGAQATLITLEPDDRHVLDLFFVLFIHIKDRWHIVSVKKYVI